LKLVLKLLLDFLFNKKPNYKFLKIGCECWLYFHPYNSHKFSFSSKPCGFLGYNKPHLGYQCLELSSSCVYIPKHVILNEQVFSFKTNSNFASVSSFATAIHLLSNLQLSSSISSHVTLIIFPQMDLPNSNSCSPHFAAHCPSVPSTSNHSSVPPPPSRTIKYPLARALLVSLDSIDIEPTYFSSAVKHSMWCDAMTNEINALLKNRTWTLVPRKPSMSIVSCIRVFRIKRKAYGSVDRYKAPLAAKGFHQQPELDFDETYYPTIKPIII
jgi:hypothetical protein